MANISKSILAGWDVLVVDDDPLSRDVATRILKHYQANVLTAENGQMGLEMIEQTRPRFIISDISMPVMDGWTFIKHLKNGYNTKDIPVIALTAHAMTGDRERAIAAGFHNYLSKPLNPETFMRDLLILLVDIPEFSLEIGD